MTTRVKIFKDKIDISDDVELKNNKSNPFGWSQSEIFYQEKSIGFIESGKICLHEAGYTFTEETEN